MVFRHFHLDTAQHGVLVSPQLANHRLHRIIQINLQVETILHRILQFLQHTNQDHQQHFRQHHRHIAKDSKTFFVVTHS